MAGGGEQDFASYGAVVDALLGSGEVDAVLLTGFFGGYSVKSEELGRRELAAAHMAAARDRHDRPLLVHSMHFAAMPNDALREREVPVFAAAEDGIAALAQAAHWRELPPETLALPAPSPPVAADDYWAARTLLDETGLPVAAGRLLVGDAPPDTAGLRYPLVAKALGLRHKSDAGGVALGIADEAALARGRRSAGATGAAGARRRGAGTGRGRSGADRRLPLRSGIRAHAGDRARRHLRRNLARYGGRAGAGRRADGGDAAPHPARLILASRRARETPP